MLIGLLGKAETGKSTIASYLSEVYDFKRFSFATILKDMLFVAGMCSAEELWGVKSQLSRWLLQKIGTDIIRKQIDPDFFVRRMKKELQHELKLFNAVIDDVRLENELKLVKELGGIAVKVIRTGYVTKLGSDHITELTVDKLPYDYIIEAKSGDIPKLVNSMDKIIKDNKQMMIKKWN